MTKQLLFLTAVFVSLPMPILGNEAGFQTSGSVLSFAPERFPTAVLFNRSLAGAHARAYALSSPVIGNGESVVGNVVEHDLGGSGALGFSSIVKIDDGAISISVPEPATVATLGIGLATIAFLIRRKKRKVHSFLH